MYDQQGNTMIVQGSQKRHCRKRADSHIVVPVFASGASRSQPHASRSQQCMLQLLHRARSRIQLSEDPCTAPGGLRLRSIRRAALKYPPEGRTGSPRWPARNQGRYRPKFCWSTPRRTKDILRSTVLLRVLLPRPLSPRNSCLWGQRNLLLLLLRLLLLAR